MGCATRVGWVLGAILALGCQAESPVVGESTEGVASNSGLDDYTGAGPLPGLLSEALDRMPIEQRAACGFFEIDGMTAAEIAEQAGVPEATIHSRLRLARQIFRRFVERLSLRDASRADQDGGER